MKPKLVTKGPNGKECPATCRCQAMRHMSTQVERTAVARGEAARAPVSDEACGPRREMGDTGSTLLEAALTRENLQQALKRVRANKGAAGVDGFERSLKVFVIATALSGTGRGISFRASLGELATESPANRRAEALPYCPSRPCSLHCA